MRSIALLAALLGIGAAAEAAPNVLLLMTDQFRGDALDHARTPHLGRLAREGCRFERAYHLWRKAYAYEGSTRIPLLVRWGAFLDAKRGQVRYEPVEIRDVLPTLLDAAGLPVPEQVEGSSLLRLVRGEGGWREILDLEHATTYWPGNVWTALTDGRFKYVFHAFDGREQLFDLETDPGETKDLAAREPERLAQWRARMVAHLAPRGAPWVVDGELGIRKKTILVGPNYPR